MDISAATTLAAGIVALVAPALVQAFKKYIPADYVGLTSLGVSILLGVITIAVASCPLIVYRRWEPFISHCFPGTAPDYLCINDDARTSMTWAQCGAGIALVPSSMARIL